MTAKAATPEVASSGWGPISENLKVNLPRLRKARGVSTTALSETLKQLGQHIPPTGITRIEKGQRRVDADDLVALALALNVSPLTLLLPEAWDGAPTRLTPNVRLSTRTAWLWAQGHNPASELPVAEDGEDPGGSQERGRAYYDLEENYRALALPPEQRQAANHPANREAEGATAMVERLVEVSEKRGDDAAAVQRSLRAARLRLKKLEAELEQIELTTEELGAVADEAQG
ncbi:helix-turn-helix domain-containing protein [Streptomyces sp. NPDC051064]|uniref:helix-turn-helix domain-containing protein n=1 Tax=Streptomyces sp. NPDC051064 TaxID=3365641 RepID=UPI00378D4B23